MCTSRPERRPFTPRTMPGPWSPRWSIRRFPRDGPLVRGREPDPGSARRTRSVNGLSPARRTVISEARGRTRRLASHGARHEPRVRPPSRRDQAPASAGQRALRAQRPKRPPARLPAGPRAAQGRSPRCSPKGSIACSIGAGGVPGFSSMRTMVRIQPPDASVCGVISGRLGENLGRRGVRMRTGLCAAGPRVGARQAAWSASGPIARPGGPHRAAPVPVPGCESRHRSRAGAAPGSRAEAARVRRVRPRTSCTWPRVAARRRRLRREPRFREST
jgi:hypothetical protein